MSTQLVFDFFDDTVPTFERTVIGRNAELVAALQCVVQTRDGNPLPAAHLYLWGDSGSGRTHLLIATAEFAADHLVGTLLATPAWRQSEGGCLL